MARLRQADNTRKSMFDAVPKVDQTVDDLKITEFNEFLANDFNRVVRELDNTVESSGQQFEGFADDPKNNNQLLKAIKIYSSYSNYYTLDTEQSSGDLYILSNDYINLGVYLDGMEVTFLNKYTSKQKAKINVNGIGEKPLYRDINNFILNGDIKENDLVRCIYNKEKDAFVVFSTNGTDDTSGSANDIFTIIPSLSTTKPKGCYPLWTGEYANEIGFSTKDLYEDFWNEAVNRKYRNMTEKATFMSNNVYCYQKGTVPTGYMLGFNTDTGWINFNNANYPSGAIASKSFDIYNAVLNYGAPSKWEVKTRFKITTTPTNYIENLDYADNISWMSLIRPNITPWTNANKITPRLTIGYSHTKNQYFFEFHYFDSDQLEIKKLTDYGIIEKDKEYYVKYGFTGNEYYIVLSEDGVEYKKVFSYLSEKKCYSYNTAYTTSFTTALQASPYCDYICDFINLYDTQIYFDGVERLPKFAVRYTKGDICTVKDDYSYDYYLQQFGQCPFFIVNEETGNVRLPIINQYLKAIGNKNALSNVFNEGLPNVTGTIGDVTYARFSGPFYKGFSTYAASGREINFPGASFDLSRANPIYGRSKTVQPKGVEIAFYIQVFNVADDASSQVGLNKVLETSIKTKELSREWAISNEIVDNDDYSSKEWATSEKVLSDGLYSAKAYAEQAAINAGNVSKNNGWSILDNKKSTHILDSEEVKGWIFSNKQDNNSGMYPDAYSKLQDSFNISQAHLNNVNFTTTVEKEGTIYDFPCILVENGFKYYEEDVYIDMIDKVGFCDGFVLDEENGTFKVPYDKDEFNYYYAGNTVIIDTNIEIEAENIRSQLMNKLDLDLVNLNKTGRMKTPTKFVGKYNLDGLVELQFNLDFNKQYKIIFKNIQPKTENNSILQITEPNNNINYSYLSVVTYSTNNRYQYYRKATQNILITERNSTEDWIPPFSSGRIMGVIGSLDINTGKKNTGIAFFNTNIVYDDIWVSDGKGVVEQTGFINYSAYKNDENYNKITLSLSMTNTAEMVGEVIIYETTEDF